MNVIIAGGPDYTLSIRDYQFLEHAVSLCRAKIVHTDGRSGVAEQAEAWARRRGLVVQPITKGWAHGGEATPEERAIIMSYRAQALIVFPGDAVTEQMLERARKMPLIVLESPSRRLVEKSGNPGSDVARQFHGGPGNSV
jgi:hypothetical protein